MKYKWETYPRYDDSDSTYHVECNRNILCEVFPTSGQGNKPEQSAKENAEKIANLLNDHDLALMKANDRVRSYANRLAFLDSRISILCQKLGANFDDTPCDIHTLETKINDFDWKQGSRSESTSTIESKS